MATNGAKRKNLGVQPGDRFIKLDKYRSEWIVKEILNFPNLPPHLHLAEAGSKRRALTFSVSAILDRKLFIPVRQPAAGKAN